MATPKYHDIRRLNKGELNALKGDVERSRIAVENITKLGAAEGKYKTEVSSLQSELQSCVASLNIESKKYKMLSELISILKGEMFNYQKTRKQEEEQEETKKDKLINKSQYEIDQILQKHNQQIAKIHNLKDLANSRRSQRVVYSSLFKKLEKEIKHFQQIYKEQLIASQLLKNNFSPEKKSMVVCTEVEEHEQASTYLEICTKQNRCSTQKSSNQKEQWNLTSTYKEESGRQKQQNCQNRKKIYLATDDKDERIEKREGQHREDKLTHTKNILNKISEYNSLIEKLKIHSESETTEQILTHFSQIEDTNKHLLDKIYECDAEIQQVNKQTKELKAKISDEEIAKMVCQQNEVEFVCNKSILNSQLIQFKNTQRQQEHAQLIQQIKQIMNVCCLHQFGNLADNQLPAELCRQLDDIILTVSTHTNPDSKSNNRKVTGNSQVAVEGLLDKMEKFNNSQKILDRDLFQQEYYRELGKKKGKQKKQSSR